MGYGCEIVRGHRLEVRAGRLAAVGLTVEEGQESAQRRKSRPGRQRLLDLPLHLGQATLLIADAEQLSKEEQERVWLSSGTAELEIGHGEALCFADIATEEHPHGQVHPGHPGQRRLSQLGGEALEFLPAEVGVLDVSRLQRVAESQHHRPAGDDGVADQLGQRAQFGDISPALGQCGGDDDGEEPLEQDVGEGQRVAEPAGHRQGLVGQSDPAGPIPGIEQLFPQPGEQSGPNRAVGLADRREGRLQHLHPSGVDGCNRTRHP